jgi:hypothetical protein
MVDKIIELDNNKSYVILDETSLDEKKYYFGLRLNEKEEPTNNYLFFEESKEGIDTFLTPIEDESMKGLLLTAFTVNFLDKVYDEV